MGWESSDVVRFNLGPLLQVQTRVAKLKSAKNLLKTRLLLILEFYNVKPIYRKSWTGNLLMGPLLQGQMRRANLKMLITCLLLVVKVWDGKPTYRKSWAGNLLVWSDLTLGSSFKVKQG